MRTREPGGSKGAESIRALLTTGTVDRWDAVAETFLLSAARADHCRRTIAPALERGAWVVSDRFIDSTFAYQGSGRDVADEFLQTVVGHSVGALMPHLTVICDVDVETARARIEHRGQQTGSVPARYEQEDAVFCERVRQGFLRRAALAPDRCVVVDTDAPPDEVAARIWSLITERFDVPSRRR